MITNIVNYKQKEDVEKLLYTLKRTNNYLTYLSNKRSFKQSKKDWTEMEGVVSYLEHYIDLLGTEIEKPLYYDLNHEMKLQYQRDYRKTHKEQNRIYAREYARKRRTLSN